jgi:endonuclease/exonuclease/phosphatase family metal-dependent hydrolase
VAAAAAGQPAVIGGDYNAPEQRAEIRSAQRAWLDTFRHLHPDADGTTHEIFWPWGRLLRRHRLDYIFFQAGAAPPREWRVLETRHLDAPGGPHSDHRAVLTQLAPAG